MEDSMIWSIVSTIATILSALAYVITVYYLRNQLKGLEKDRYLNVTNQLFSIWHSKEFMTDQLWLLHLMSETTWEDFIAAHRADRGEVAFHRIGAFYDRVGTLVRMGVINEKEILSTMGGHAIAVWAKIRPLVYEARRLEHSTLFDDFEKLLPACYECYVPSLGPEARLQPVAAPRPPTLIEPAELASRLNRGDAITVLDVRHNPQPEPGEPGAPNLVAIPLDSISSRYTELPRDDEIAVLCA
jgi:hypothetical protein